MTGPDTRHTTTTLYIEGEDRRFEDLPVEKLIGAFLYWRAIPLDVSQALARHIRARLPEKNTSPFLRAKLNTADPPPCACGKKGIYIVGETTYCRNCKPIAEKRRRENLMWRDKRARYIDQHLNAIDQSMRFRERIKNVKHLKQRTKQKP